ncbi:hypothetical protein DFH11DRAFT_1731130 [Phellopilus nigrolimitatus]|nr:hypothetical protein DFH11DRAFT_1731130 [Phellopilus nigrolimitatus]
MVPSTSPETVSLLSKIQQQLLERVTDSPTLYAFLRAQNQTATHYMIGLNILSNWQEFLIASTVNDDDIAVHTWTHPYMTTLSNADVLSQLAWTMQIIYDSTGGRVPRFWRPPYGDIDTRVSAIASAVLGITAVLWNQDTEDWSVGSPGGTTLPAIQTNMQTWLTGSKTPGLIILEHELNNNTIGAFMAAWPLAHQNNWTTVSQARLNASAGPEQDGRETDAAFNSLIPASSSAAAPSAASASAASASASASAASASASASAAAKAGDTASAAAQTAAPAFLGLLAAAAVAALAVA